ncbi:hypothetical protein [Thalassovita sp.]|uniref:hypothetical protein n=1 Tax=Thalassovita sp. TaxID=1979401 RepID=UPI00288148A9|nr:hypothetical protein [Thalassovita sp.]MDF1804520.1 hypothetical protein [Thalassovita sp.]
MLERLRCVGLIQMFTDCAVPRGNQPTHDSAKPTQRHKTVPRHELLAALRRIP